MPNPYSEKALNLNLGLPLSSNGLAFKALRFFGWFGSTIFRFTLEKPLFLTWKSLPVSLRSFISFKSWSVWLYIHKNTLGKSTALHPSLSHEYAALTTVMWAARLFPMTLSRMRFGLNQIECNFPPHPHLKKTTINASTGAVRGVYISSQSGSPSVETRRVLFWLFGGAFLSGDVSGNVGLAESVALAADCDVFLADYRICPENTIFDASEDVRACYEWLINESGKVASGSQVSVLGISSGGGLALRLCQQIAATKDPKLQLASSILLCPWVHYDWENLFPSLKENVVHDLIVTQAVYDYVVPLAETMAGGAENRLKVSPLSDPCTGICPTFILASTHEVTYDEDLALYEKCKAEGVDVQFFTKEYLCHVFCLIPHLPESKEGMKAAVDFMKAKW
mmetsp:Transcript_25975/g.48997  ORF Transcript_25975/g.48997 Transcript_25975/m.48997 type:complete len:395 (-) Transcript_25975:84-1268(-)|eukprot:CAMPEP_0182496976 /NCGR_PEP_ID=MMETSP1321-20130603/5545_1 /TAXON_ID=91990 /ORGANISM="Bolidomonas sp., Strain RCC1657" /LENGTH=394 /DNA_ID=CAMNT_0024700733 /DNA_START=59 /DNA_END=1243 /DNA_ORIENTATION=+